jgi:hypothetical protein
MTKDDITRMAKEAGFCGFDGDNKCLREFAELVAAAEREACAKTVMEYDILYIGSYPINEQFADAIRARGQPEPWVKTYSGGKPNYTQPMEQETISEWIKANTEHRQWYICPKCSYQAPRFRDKWQGLTDEERLRCFDDVDWNKVDWCPDHEQYAKAIEAKLKEKNT